jgi:hypothetical protein
MSAGTPSQSCASLSAPIQKFIKRFFLLQLPSDLKGPLLWSPRRSARLQVPRPLTSLSRPHLEGPEPSEFDGLSRWDCLFNLLE